MRKTLLCIGLLVGIALAFASKVPTFALNMYSGNSTLVLGLAVPSLTIPAITIIVLLGAVLAAVVAPDTIRNRAFIGLHDALSWRYRKLPFVVHDAMLTRRSTSKTRAFLIGMVARITPRRYDKAGILA